MKDLLSKEHHSYKIYTLLMKSSAYHPLPSLGSPPSIYRLHPPFLDLDLLPLLRFLKNPNSL